MDLQAKLRSLVNKHFTFYPKKENLNREDVNKYDSDDEGLSDFEESPQSNAEEKTYETVLVSADKKFKEEETELTYESMKKENLEKIEKMFTYSENSIHESPFIKKREDYIDQNLLNLIEGIDFINLEKESIEKATNEIFSNFLNSMKIETTDQAIFFYHLFYFFLKRSAFSCKRKSFNLMTEQCREIINKLIIDFKDHRYVSKNKKLLTIKELRLLSYLFGCIDTLIDFSEHFLKQDSLNFLQFLNWNFLENLTDKNEDLSYNNILRGHLKNIFVKIHRKLTFDLFILTSDNLKELFSISFMFLTYRSMANAFIPFMEIICIIIKRNNEFVEKFIENSIGLFQNFVDQFNIPNDKIHFLEKKYYRIFSNHFGNYKCYNGDIICIYNLLLVKIFSVLYSEDENMDKGNFSFNKVYENFIFRILTIKKNNLLYLIYFLLEDLLTIKYNTEFFISSPLLNNFFISLSNLLSLDDMDITRKKFFLNCFDLITINILNDFKTMQTNYFCFSQNDKKCECFSCKFSDSSKNSEYATCKLCRIKTNLVIQLLPKQKNDLICGLCEIKGFFDKISGNQNNLLNNENSIVKPESESENENENVQMTAVNNNIETDKIEKSQSQNPESKKKTALIIDFLNYKEKLLSLGIDIRKIFAMNFLSEAHKGRNSIFIDHLDISYQVFLTVSNRIFNEEASACNYYLTFFKNVYYNYKEKICNIFPDVYIDEKTLKFFYFISFYSHIILSGFTKMMEILFEEKNHFLLRYKCLKSLERFLIFEKEKVIFPNFQIEFIGSLLADSSYYIREYSLEVILKFYKFNKIDHGTLMYILYENLNEPSFLIRRRIVKSLIVLMKQEKSTPSDHFNNVNFIFLNKLIDNSESLKIKHTIIDFYSELFSVKKNKEEICFRIIDSFISILNEGEEFQTSNNHIVDHLNKLFIKVFLIYLKI
jgi:hypothetical protein